MSAARFPIEALRRLSESFMPDTCRILAPSRAENEYGPVEGEPTLKAALPCRLEAPSGSEGVINERVRSRVSARVVLPFGAPVEGSDILEVEGRRFAVEYIPPRTADYAAHTEVYVSDTD